MYSFSEFCTSCNGCFVKKTSLPFTHFTLSEYFTDARRGSNCAAPEQLRGGYATRVFTLRNKKPTSELAGVSPIHGPMVGKKHALLSLDQ
jgi:hypothetical protein